MSREKTEYSAKSNFVPWKLVKKVMAHPQPLKTPKVKLSNCRTELRKVLSYLYLD